MNLRFVTLTIALACSLMSAVFAQAVQPTDFIVAVVNAEPITNNEVRLEVKRVTQGLEQLQQVVPTPQVLRNQVLERLINDRAQLQFAKETGIRIDSGSIDLAEENAARQKTLAPRHQNWLPYECAPTDLGLGPTKERFGWAWLSREWQSESVPS